MIVEAIIFLLVLAAIGLGLYILSAIGSGALNVPFVSFTVGTLLWGASRAFLYLSDNEIFHLADVDTHIWWHAIFYFSIASFIWGGFRLWQIAQANGQKYSWRDTAVLSVFVLCSLAIFFVAQPLEHTMAPLFVGSFVDSFGLHHFLAILFAAIAAIYIHKMRTSWGKLLAVSVNPLLLFLVLLSIQHMWEILTESWKVIPIAAESGEQVEQFIVGPALVALVLGLWRIAGFIRLQNKTPQGPAQVIA